MINNSIDIPQYMTDVVNSVEFRKLKVSELRNKYPAIKGTSREVYYYNDDFVIKRAFDCLGLAQNYYEYQTYKRALSLKKYNI